MEGVLAALGILRDHNLAKGKLRGVLRLFIATPLAMADGTLISKGLTWRQLAQALRQARFDKYLAAEVGADPETLSPRDRERFWYSVIGMADVGSVEAAKQADQVLKSLKSHGIVAAS